VHRGEKNKADARAELNAKFRLFSVKKAQKPLNAHNNCGVIIALNSYFVKYI
jgi:hypothetical protein